MPEKNLTNKEIEAVQSGKKEIDFEYFSERGFKEYMNNFNLAEGELKGKKILDMGPSFNFQKEAKEKGIDVIAVDPFNTF